MAVGGAIGTGLFLGSGLTVAAAGPAVILSYLVAAAISLLLSAALTEMAVAHPAAGSFGIYAERYLSPFAGYAVRVSYWLMQVIATGGHMVALKWSMKNHYGIEPGETYWAASDVGWVVGHSYICYAPLLHGCTSILFEGKPVHGDLGAL